MLDISKLKFVEFVPGTNKENLTNAEKEAFQLWHSCWTDAYKYFGWKDQVFSDQWTRQDLVGVLFYEDNPIGVICFKIHDLSHPFAMYDSCLRMWPKEIIGEAISLSKGTKCLVPCWLTVHPEWRKQKPGFDTRYILSSFATEKLLDSNVDLMLASVVRSSNMHKAVYDSGAEPLKINAKEKDLEIDLVIWRKERLKDFQYPRFNAEIKSIYQTSIKTLRRAS
jgi:hypothetical protein